MSDSPCLEQSRERGDSHLLLPCMQTHEAMFIEQKSSPLFPLTLPIFPFVMQQQDLPSNDWHLHFISLLRARQGKGKGEVKAGGRIDETGRPRQVIIQQQDRPDQRICPPHLPSTIGRTLLPLFPCIEFNALTSHLQTIQSSCLTPSVRRGAISCNLDLVLAIEGMGRGRRACFGLSRRDGFLFEGRSILSALTKNYKERWGRTGI